MARLSIQLVISPPTSLPKSTAPEHSGTYQAIPAAKGRTKPSLRAAGGLVVIGALALVGAQVLKTRLPAPDEFVALVTHPAWVPLKIAQVSGFLLIILGLLYLYGELVDHGEVMLTIAWFSAAVIAAIARSIEFTLAVIVIPTFVGSMGTELARPQFDAILLGYRALGNGLIFLVSVFAGLGIALLGVALYRANLYHRLIGATGAVLGAYLAVQKVVSPNLINLEPLDIPSLVLLTVWFIVLGVSMIRSVPGPD